MIKLGNLLAALFEWLERRCARASYRLKRCPCCGENIMYGQPCPELQHRTTPFRSQVGK